MTLASARTQVLAAGAAALAMAACSGGDPAPGIQAGQSFPLRTFPRLAAAGEVAVPGMPATPVLVNVWATWCEPCRREMQSFERLHRHYGSQLRVVGLSVDGDRNLAREFVAREGLTFENGLAPQEELARGELAVTRLPTTFLVDASGVVRLREEAPRDWSDPATLGRLERLLAMRLERR